MIKLMIPRMIKMREKMVDKIKKMVSVIKR